MATTYAKMLQRRDTAANWSSNNPVLAAGEIGIETDTNKFKFGNGSSAWNSLAYAGGGSTINSIDDISDVDTATTAPTNGQALVWNSLASQWVPGPSVADISIGSGDPYFSNVLLLLHLNGANNSTSFPDSSPNNFSVSFTNSAVITTSQSKFGGASLSLPGSSSNLSVASNSAFVLGAGDFTIECWVYLPSARFSPIYYYGVNVYITADGALGIQDDTTSTNISGSPGAVPLNTWVHVAWTRASGTVRGYVNGVECLNAIFNYTFGSGTAVRIGRKSFVFEQADWFVGYLDELRVTKSVARYTSNFTAPTAPFSDTGTTTYSINSSIGNLDDVDTATTAPTVGQALVWNGTDWVPGASVGGIVITDSPPAGNVDLLFEFNGTQGATTTIDSGPDSRSVSLFDSGTNTVILDTSIKKFGASSLKVSPNSSRGWFTAGPCTNIDVGDFTMECWVYFPTAVRDLGSFSYIWSTNSWAEIGVGCNGANPVLHIGSPRVTHQNAFSANTWHHVAVVKISGVFYIYLDGVRSNTSYSNGSPINSPSYFAGLNGNIGTPFSYYIDSAMFTQGLARYTQVTESVPLTGDYTTAVSYPYNINSLSDVDTVSTAPTSGQSLVWNGTNWVPGTRIQSNTTQGGTGSLAIANIVRISQANYDALGTKDSNTLYVIV